MNIAICIPGQLRCFTKYYDNLIQNVILPLENSNKINQVSIFLECFTIKKKYNENPNSKYNIKMHVDTEGIDEISKSKYFKYCNLYNFTDDTIYQVFKDIKCKYSPDDLEKYQKKLRSKNNMAWKRLTNGVCQLYNNKKLIEKVPDNYDIIMRMRSDVEYIKKFPVEKILNCKNNTLYFCTSGYYLSKGGDTFFFGNTKLLKNVYKNLYHYLRNNVEKYVKSGNITPESILDDILIDLDINPMSINYRMFKHWKIIRNYIGPKYK